MVPVDRAVGYGQWHQGAFACDFEKNDNTKSVHMPRGYVADVV